MCITMDEVVRGVGEWCCAGGWLGGNYNIDNLKDMKLRRPGGSWELISLESFLIKSVKCRQFGRKRPRQREDYGNCERFVDFPNYARGS